jgi:hypothetical protein
MFPLLAVSAIAMNRFIITFENVESVYSNERGKRSPRKKEENGEVFKLQKHETIEGL